MRVARIEIKNHPSIGDLEVDLRDAQGHAARLVVLAGDNGCGKTALLEAVFRAISGTYDHSEFPASALTTVFIEDRRRIFHAKHHLELSKTHFDHIIQARKFMERQPYFEGIMIGDHHLITLPELSPINRTSLSEITDCYPGCFYSEANLAFDVPRIDSFQVQASNTRGALLSRKSEVMRSGKTLGLQISQLFADLKAADDEHVADWAKQHIGEAVPDEAFDLRLRRFKNAFAQVMPHKQLSKVERNQSGVVTVFREKDFSTTLSTLSMGEKQIVFRGAFLLRFFDYLAGNVVLIDEPELSLHPNWQANILAYYDAIVAETAEKTSQIIIATHSPFVVHGSPTAKHVVLKRNPSDRGNVVVSTKPTYPYVSTSEVAIAAFDLENISFGASHAKLAVVTEGKTDVQIIQTAWQKLRGESPRPFLLVPAGGAKTIQNLVGNGANEKGWLLDTLRDRGVDRYLCLFDFDREGFGQWNGLVTKARSDAENLDIASGAYRKRAGERIWSTLLPIPSYRETLANFDLEDRSKVAIELLFEDQYLEGKLSKEPQPGPKDFYIFSADSSQKTSFANAAADFDADAFRAFEPFFARIETILKEI